jgi:hypothetical protein
VGPGADLSPLTENATTEAASKALRDTINDIQMDLTDPMFNAVESGLAPVTHVLDGLNAQTDSTIDSALKGNLVKPGAARSTTLASSPVTKIPALDGFSEHSKDTAPKGKSAKASGKLAA